MVLEGLVRTFYGLCQEDLIDQREHRKKDFVFKYNVRTMTKFVLEFLRQNGIEEPKSKDTTFLLKWNQYVQDELLPKLNEEIAKMDKPERPKQSFYT